VQTSDIYGLGRVGYLQEKLSLEQFCHKVKDTLDVEHLRYSAAKNNMVHKVAVLGGSGEKYIDAAIQHNADVYVTGDVTFHPAQDAIESGLSVIDAGHYIEKIMKQATVDYLTEEFPNINIMKSAINTDPFQFA